MLGCPARAITLPTGDLTSKRLHWGEMLYDEMNWLVTTGSLYCSFSTKSTHQISWGAKKCSFPCPSTIRPSLSAWTRVPRLSLPSSLFAGRKQHWWYSKQQNLRSQCPNINFLARSVQVISQSPCSNRATLLQKSAQHDVFICFPLFLFVALAGFVPGGSNRLWANWFSNHIASCINSTPT